MRKKLLLLSMFTLIFTGGFDSTNRVVGKTVGTKNLQIAKKMMEVTEPIEVTVNVKAEREPLPYSDEEIDLLALLTMAEAEGESEEGKRLVIDTVLNRVDHEYYPDTISGVIYQSGQFTSMWNGRSSRCYVRDDIRQLVIEEMYSRTNHDVIYFTAGGYGRYGKRLFSVGNHYFAAY